jgi:large subunit ribosomal protein L25
MHEITLKAEKRLPGGATPRALRRSGRVPGIYYIHGETTIGVAVQRNSLNPLIFTKESHIVNLSIDAENRKCILRDIQFDPVTEAPIHFDLLGLREDEEITLEIPVVITGGTPAGVRDGGILQHNIRALKISCLPRFIPNSIEVNAEGLKMNEFVHVRDLKRDNVTILAPEADTVLGVIPPTVEKEPTPETAAAEPTEPEVIAKGKKLDEEGEGEGAAGGEAKAAGKAEPKAEKKPEGDAKKEAKKK